MNASRSMNHVVYAIASERVDAAMTFLTNSSFISSTCRGVCVVLPMARVTRRRRIRRCERSGVG